MPEDEANEPYFVLTDAARAYLLRCEVEAECAEDPARGGAA